MTEITHCAKDGCYEPIEHLCQVCKGSFCSKHAQKGQFRTNTGKLQYATLCLNDLEIGFEGDLTPSKGFSRLSIQLFGLALIILVIYGIFVAISSFF